jgi:hypothetical protein
VKDQVHIRNLEAAHLARALARQTGKTITDVVLDALRQYQPGRAGAAEPDRIANWRRLLREDRKAGLAEPETPIDALYDASTGLPA